MLSTSLSRDLYLRFIHPAASDAKVLSVARAAALAGGAGGTALAVVSGSIVEALSIFYTLLAVSLFVPLVVGLYYRRVKTPEAIASTASGVTVVAVVQVTAGGVSSGALTDKSKCFTWGYGGHYNLGHGTTDKQTKPKLVESLTKYTITQLALGFRHGLALDDNGNVYSWGHGGYGQHGHGHNDDQQLPKQIEYFKEN